MILLKLTTFEAALMLYIIRTHINETVNPAEELRELETKVLKYAKALENLR